MAHGLRGFGLLALVGAVGCNAAEKIPPQRIQMSQLPKPELPASSPTAANTPGNPPADNRGKVTPAAAAMPVSDAPTPGQPPSIGGPPPAGNPATLPLSPGNVKVPGRGAPAASPPLDVPTVPGVSPSPTPPAGLKDPTPPEPIPAPLPPVQPPPLGGKPIDIPPMPSPANR